MFAGKINTKNLRRNTSISLIKIKYYTALSGNSHTVVSALLC